MMRWLKDKKRERRSNSTSQIEDEKEDDYGFGKEKAVTKSPSSRRELPPTPATPEEKSPHIYEEIPDLSLRCILESERGLHHSKFSKSKNGFTVAPGTIPQESSSIVSKPGSSEKDEISPYMIVPVDNEVRQTPTDFHRNGTPEVHCDVIVKDTHCEILLTRKPKVSAFRLDNPVTGESEGDKRSIRNNTHFCSRDRRASAYVQNSGNQSSAFSVTSSGFSSSSVSKIHSGGASSSLTLGNLTDAQKTCEESDCDKTAETGVVTYSTASNFIPRATKLVFNPLTGKNPRKEAFGSDSSDELHGAGYSSIKNDDFGAGGASFSSSWEHQSGSKCVTYTTVESRDNLDPSGDSQVTYASVQDQHFMNSKTKSNYSFDEQHNSQFCLKQPKSMSSSSNDINSFVGASRTGIIRPVSPSNSSNCIYALVTFPTEPKHYNTIADITASGFAEGEPCPNGGFNTESLGVIYSSVNGAFNSDVSSPSGEIADKRKPSELAFLGKTPFHLSDTQRKLSQTSCLNYSETVKNAFNVERIRFDSSSENYAGIANHSELKNGQDMSSGVKQGNCLKTNSESHSSAGLCENGLQLEFCFCSDEHSSSCGGCPETKHRQDDDLASVAGAASDGSNSCRSCGRLIRQITYSESYSDETYDHVYASRLLIRTGRRFSSPDITVSEASNSEFPDTQSARSPDFPYPVSRDDSWASTRNSDIFPPPYSASTGSRAFSKIDDSLEFKGHILVDELGCSYGNRESRDQFQGQIINSKLAEQTNSAVSQLVSTLHTLNSSATRSSIIAPSKQLNHPLNDETHGPKTENFFVVDNSVKSLVSPNIDDSKSCVEPAIDKSLIDKSRKLDPTLTLELKSSGITGLFTKLSRAKSSKAAKLEPAEMANCSSAQGEKPKQSQALMCDKDLEEIPEKNTKKLSKFFQRLASKENTKDTLDSSTPKETDELSSAQAVNDAKLAGKSSKLFTLENNTITTNSQKYYRDETQSTALHLLKITDETKNSNKSSSEFSEKRIVPQTHIFPAKPQNCSPGYTIASAALSDQQTPELTKILDSDAATTSEGLLPNAKPQFKTDSGDTCYEYDISTSSEGEQTGYEYFLSKVKKTLKLEHEEHIAESNCVRRKRLCKRCKNEEMYSTADDEDEDVAGRDGLCPHIVAKLGDMRAIFEDLVIDQRAVILDCLSDYTLSPFIGRGHSHDGFCRECGCEIVTSDSESLTTICSLLSQQFRMTSPNGQTLSCDSDEGTMADNSCESADENGEVKSNNNNGSNKNYYDGNSSGYDEPKEKSENVLQKLRKKERKDKKLATSAVGNSTTKVIDNLSLTMSTAIQDNITTEVKTIQPLTDEQRTTIPPVFSENHRKSILKKNTTQLSAHSSKHSTGLHSSSRSEPKDDHSDHSRICDINRSRTSSITDKVLQDIYAPLPSKALSLLTSRSNGSPVGLTCTCGKGLQAPIATVTAHLTTGKTITPPTGCTKDNSLKLLSASLPLCDGDNKFGVVSVQKHSEKVGKNASEVEQFILCERKDISKSDQRTMDVHTEKEVIVNNGCTPSQKNAETNDCLPSQTKSGHCIFRKEWSTVPGKRGNLLRNRSSTKQLYEPASKGNCSVFASVHQEEDKCSQMSLLHTTTDSTERTLNSEIRIADSSECAYSERQCSDDMYERFSVEQRTDNSKSECARKYRLKIVALDLLPESAVDGDTTETAQPHKKVGIQPKRSKVIEKMAQMFETNSDSTNTDQKLTKIKEVMALDVATEKYIRYKTTQSNKYICESESVLSQPHKMDAKSEVSESAFNCANTSRVQCLPGTVSFNLTRQDNLCARPENCNLNLNANPPTSDLLTASKTLRSRSGSKQGKESETKQKYDNEGGRLKHELKPVKVKTGKTKSLYLTESKLLKQRSPTPSSTSSVSSSSSSKRKNGHSKHKMSKKSYHRKRSKYRSDRSKIGHGKEERTYYYFSSDFSDIDVVEIKCEPYTKSVSMDASVNNKFALGKKKRCASSDDLLMASSENGTNIPTSSPNNTEGADGGFCEQEVYAIPVSSSDILARKNGNETGISPQPSPEMTKCRKMKRTDVYKSKKSNNKLLSDLIIRNYDMQVYGNI